MFGGIYTPIYKTRNRCVWGTLAWSAWISSCSRTKCLQECRITLVWMGWLLRHTYKLQCCKLNFSFRWLWACPVLWSREALPSQPSASASHAVWWAVVEETGPLQHPSFATMLSHCTGIIVFLKNKKFLLIISPSPWTSERPMIFQKGPALSAIRQLWLRSHMLHKTHSELALLEWWVAVLSDLKGQLVNALPLLPLLAEVC